MNTQPYQGEEQGSQSSNHQIPANSILVADCGSVFTKVSLLGIVEGQYRLMACGEAPTTVSAPHEDITQGVIQAINQIEFITGRRLVTDGRILSPEKPNGDGVDVFVATISAGGPLRIVVLGAVSAMLDTFAAQAMSGLYAETYALPAPSYVATSMPA
ncbi:MAG TPA: glutamate mutase L, partial [Ktedonobacteraceae bacterium]|nr:glutamate mutase L [Ktedonobacteraceae bacterium]